MMLDGVRWSVASPVARCLAFVLARSVPSVIQQCFACQYI